MFLSNGFSNGILDTRPVLEFNSSLFSHLHTRFQIGPHISIDPQLSLVCVGPIFQAVGICRGSLLEADRFQEVRKKKLERKLEELKEIER